MVKTKLTGSEIQSVLDERREQYEGLDIDDSLSEPVDADRFYKFVSKIQHIGVSEDDDVVSVTFSEPVPGLCGLSDGYGYTVEVGRPDDVSPKTRYDMPRAELITLHQIAIVVWVLATGEIY